MSIRARSVALSTVVAALSACGSIETDKIVTAVLPVQPLSATCAVPALDAGLKADVDAFRTRIEEVRSLFQVDHQHFIVIAHALDLFAASVLHDRAVAPLSMSDFKNFSEEFHQKIHTLAAGINSDVSADVRNKLVRDMSKLEGGEAEFRANVERDLDLFKTVAIAYFAAYFDGKYIDRYGNRLAAPAISQTIGDAAIAGSVSVLFDAIADFTLRTPLWQDAKGNYYPAAANASAGGNGSTQAADKPGAKAGIAAAAPSGPGGGLVPTLATLIDDTSKKNLLVDVLPLLPDGTTCGIDSFKAKAIEVLAQAAGQSGSLVSGSIGGSFGGFGFALGPFGKVSVGDNQTVITVTRAVVGKTAERSVETLAYHAIYGMEDNGLTLPALIEKLTKPPTSTPPAKPGA